MEAGTRKTMEKEIEVAEVRTFDTSGGNTRFVVRDADGDEYTTFRERIGEAAMRAEGSRAKIAYHEQQRGQYTNVYLDSIEPLPSGDAGESGDDTDPEEAGWRTAVEAAPWLVGSDDADKEVEPDEMFEKLKPFKDRVAEDIREREDG
jgi:hypothetical protein